MKNLMLLVFLLAGSSSIAQKSEKAITLSKGQKINVVNTISSDADMGMGIQMKNNMVMSNTIAVTGENEKEYSLTNALTKAKGSMEVMGQVHEFDSENPSPQDAEMNKSFTEAVGKSINVTVNKYSGAVTIEKKDAGPEKPETDPMENMMNAFGIDNDDASVTGAFFLIPSGKKAGDSWTETDSTKEKKLVRTYIIKAIDNTTATVSFNFITDINSTVEAQGNQVDISMNTKTTGNIITDTKTGLVSKRTSDSDISGTMSMMGQSMPVTGKGNVVSVFTLVKN